jgi:hypothetical protein
MARFAVPLLVSLALTGCGTSTRPQAEERNEKGTTTPPITAEERKPKHDYQGWVVFAPEEGRFKVRFPKEPATKPAGPATGGFNVAGVPRQAAEQLGYIFQWKIREAPFSNKEEEAVYLKSQQSGSVQATKGKLLQDKELTTDRFTARECLIEVDGQNVIRRRAYVAGNRVITLSVMGKDAGAVQAESADKFFDSIEISP